jgi:hypothetical protein
LQSCQGAPPQVASHHQVPLCVGVSSRG